MIKLTLKTLKLNHKAMIFETVATFSREYTTIKLAESFLKTYVYKLDEQLSKGPVDIWAKRVNTRQGEYIFRAELQRGA